MNIFAQNFILTIILRKYFLKDRIIQLELTKAYIYINKLKIVLKRISELSHYLYSTG